VILRIWVSPVQALDRSYPLTNYTNPRNSGPTGISPSPPSDDYPEFVDARKEEKNSSLFWGRQVAESNNRNTLVSPPVLAADWCIEPEIPRPEGTFLQWPTRRVFLEEKVQIRIQILYFRLSANAKVQILIRKKGTIFDDDVFLITNDADIQKKSEVPSDLRTLKEKKDVGNLPQDDTHADLCYETDSVAGVTFLVTTVDLPILKEMESAVSEYYANVRIIDQGWSSEERSPTLEAIPWWAHPLSNLSYPKLKAKDIQPLIDGEAYFKEITSAFESAKNYIYIASWKMWYMVHLTGEPGGGGKRLDSILLDRANAGVKIFIRMDYINAGWVVPLLEKYLKHKNIFVKTATHPLRVFVLVPAGSYHEKYCCIDGKVAFVGGIDLEPDKNQPESHGWKSELTGYRAEAAGVNAEVQKVFDEKYKQFWLWHDVGAKVTGDPVANLELDFAVRWNQSPGGNDLKPPSMPQLAQGQAPDLQVVKTHNENVSTMTTSLSGQGTLEIYKNAIREARHYIYIENQYLNYPPLGEFLAEALNKNAKLQLIAVLPFFTEENAGLARRVLDRTWGPFWFDDEETKKGRLVATRERLFLHATYNQAQIIHKLRAVPDAANRVGFFTLAGCTATGTPEMIYPHAKTMVVDDTWAYIGSANTNGRGFVIDEEIGIVIHDRKTVTGYRNALWKEHLKLEVETRTIREFLTLWQKTALKGKSAPSDCTCGELAKGHACELLNPLPGQEYNGPLEFGYDFDSLV
jgi:phosphatidylserine/phosphatidylglycerophosphate/cardiolipin synthase-like enzyme